MGFSSFFFTLTIAFVSGYHNISMDDRTKDNQGPSSGEIFSQNKEHSAYEEALSAPSEDLKKEETVEEVQAPPPPPPLAGENLTAPPPFVVDNRKKILIILVAVVFFILLIVFLVSVLRSRTKTASQNDEKVELTYWGLWESPEVVKPVIDEYQKQNKNVTVNYIRQDPIQYRQRLEAAIERGEGPDLFRFHNSWLPMLVKQLSPVPKDIMSDADFEKNYFPVVTKDLKSGGNYYGLPLEIDGLLLYYNEDILKGANVEVPKTWLDVQNAIPKLTVKDGKQIVTAAIAMGTAENIEHFSDIIALMLLQNGTNISQSLFSCADTSSKTCATEALSFYRRFAQEPNATWSTTLENSLLAFAGGKVAMIFAPSWQAHVINTINPNLNFKTAKVPQLPCDRNPCPEVHLASYWVEGVSQKSKKAAEAFKFLQFLSLPTTMEKLYAQQNKVNKLFGEPYSRIDLINNLKDNVYLSPLISQAPSFTSSYLISRTYDGETGLNTSLNTYLKDAVNSMLGGTSAETALTTADSGFKQVYERFGLATKQ